MTRALTASLTACLVTLAACWAPPADAKSPPQHLVLNGNKVRVNWNDGDSFKVLDGPDKGLKARLVGFNTLESYGPVHFWGAFHAYELYDIAKASQKLAKSQVWECQTQGDRDGYGRALVVCPEFAKQVVAKGLAHVFVVAGEAPEGLLERQLEAQRDQRGMWAKGVPSEIVTSIHSTSEDGGKGATAYNRACDTRTGLALPFEHATDFQPCDAWCRGASCMVYVPFEVRYGKDRPECLRRGRDNRLVLPPHLRAPLEGH